jgi:hypothetical protein
MNAFSILFLSHDQGSKRINLLLDFHTQKGYLGRLPFSALPHPFYLDLFLLL